tara:strand:- start:190 stop:300 length:111 start_codon:yes stop_codon:yes gene_type:complete
LVVEDFVFGKGARRKIEKGAKGSKRKSREGTTEKFE